MPRWYHRKFKFASWATLTTYRYPDEMDQATIVIQPARTVQGSLLIPGDKSISHRYAMLAAIAEGVSEFSNFSQGADCASTLDCLRALGCQVTNKSDGAIEIIGLGPKLSPPERALDCGNSGSTMRMLAGILAGQDFSCELKGDESLSRRPMARIIEPLQQMGARISATDGGRPPLKVMGAGSALKAINYRVPIASAQVKSSILFAGLFADGETLVEEPLPTRDHGELALHAFGADVQRSVNRAGIKGKQHLHAIQAQVPGDTGCQGPRRSERSSVAGQIRLPVPAST